MVSLRRQFPCEATKNTWEHNYSNEILVLIAYVSSEDLDEPGHLRQSRGKYEGSNQIVGPSCTCLLKELYVCFISTTIS